MTPPVTSHRPTHRSWLAAVVLLLAVAGCQPPGDGKGAGETSPAATERKASALEQNASADGDKATPSRTEIIGKPDVQAVDPEGREPLDDPITCLARTIYWEARGEAAASTEAVASVVMNRLGHAGFPDTVCAVVRQGRESGACQFSWWCDGRSDRAREDEAYAAAKEIARRALNLQLKDRTRGALYFHHRDVTPGWSTAYLKTAEIGEFVFYKPRDGDAR
ncbi:MAG: cell wall hydrolase [Gammaproteobacteria bacterium]|nr:cell wall hydrolase [Gammaproteobacteria bacterium]